MNATNWPAIWAILLLVAVAQATPAVETPAVATPAALLARHCGECHAGGATEGGLSLEGVTAFANATPDVWSAVHEKLQLGLMPPPEAERLPDEDRARLVSWIADAMREAGKRVNDKLEWPNYGNYVPHEPLFRGPHHPAPATRVRLWRQRPENHANGRPAVQPFAMLPGQQISDYAAIYVVDESAAEIVLRNAEQVVERWTAVEEQNGKLVAAKGSQGNLLPILQPDPEPTPEQFAQCVNWSFHQAIGRRATPEELEGVREMYDTIAAAHGRLQAGRAALMSPLLLPEAVYRLELGAGELDEHGRRRLSKDEILLALRQTLFSGNPWLPTIHEARKPDVVLATREEVAVLVKTLLESTTPEQPVNARVLEFFDEFLDYRKARDVFKEVPSGVRFAIGELIDDTRRLIATIVAEDRDVLRRLLTTHQTYVGTPVDPHQSPPSHAIYNLPADFKWRRGLVELATEERAGILTQPAWLVAHSGNFDNDPVRRGKWVLERLLGGTVPDLPVTVCAVVPEDHSKTLRERFEVVSNDSYCWKCHRQMNQLGMPFEAYDHFGRYRLRELDRPVNASGAIVDSGDPRLDGEVTNPVELIRRLGGSDRAREVFVRYAFRYFLGRNETLRDAQTLREADQAYTSSGGSVKALVVSLLSSDSFLYRTPEAE
jgi:mono/diheme cytochrome c family protein